VNGLPRGTSLALVRATITMIMVFAPLAVQAHLLNMTEVELRADDTQHLTLHLAFDPSRYFDNRLDYYSASQKNDALNNPKIVGIVQQALGAVALTMHNTDASITKVANSARWQVHSIRFKQGGRAQYLDPLQWPLMRVHASLKLDKPARIISAKFTADFIFEEPIALTLMSTERDKSMTRWLITQQSSPNFALDAAAENRIEILVNDTTHGLYFYFSQGFLHILPFGYDHLLFVLALLVTSLSSRQLITSLTVFTLAHSMTLIISLFGIVRLPSHIVEPLIALSIAWIAIESFVFKASVKWRYVVVFTFGLLHGMGFASAIGALGLPAVGTLLSLLAFNLGIEVGQLVFVAALLLPTHLIICRHTGIKFNWDNHQRWRSAVAVCLGIIGLLWTIIRVIS
jgi:hypothetical protein